MSCVPCLYDCERRRNWLGLCKKILIGILKQRRLAFTKADNQRLIDFWIGCSAQNPIPEFIEEFLNICDEGLWMIDFTCLFFSQYATIEYFWESQPYYVHAEHSCIVWCVCKFSMTSSDRQTWYITRSKRLIMLIVGLIMLIWVSLALDTTSVVMPLAAAMILETT